MAKGEVEMVGAEGMVEAKAEAKATEEEKTTVESMQKLPMRENKVMQGLSNKDFQDHHRLSQLSQTMVINTTTMEMMARTDLLSVKLKVLAKRVQFLAQVTTKTQVVMGS